MKESIGLGETAENGLDGFTKAVAKQLATDNVNVKEDILKKALIKGREHLLGCDQCANGWHW